MKLSYEDKPRVHSVDTFIYTYKFEHPKEIVPSTKTLYNDIHQGLLDIKVIDLPKVVRIRKKTNTRPSTKKYLGTSIEKRPDDINDRLRRLHNYQSAKKRFELAQITSEQVT